MSCFNVLSTKKLKTALVEQIISAGLKLTETEFIRIDPAVNDKEIKEFIDSIKQDAHVIFTSSNAVEAVADHAAHERWKVFCISGKTRETVLSKLQSAELVATADSGGELAKEIIQCSVNEVSFFSGDIRRDEMPTILKEAGVKIEELVVYRTVATPVKIKSNFDGVLFFSPSAVKSFFSVNQLSSQAICFAIGGTTAEEVKIFSHNQVIVADAPTQESLVQKLINYYKSSVQS
jgi:uroporphyrinogen-III synthase